MPTWEKWLGNSEEGVHRPPKRKFNKNYVCKKNKLGGGRFGEHIYDIGKSTCKLCGHIKKSSVQTFDIDDLSDMIETKKAKE